MHIRFSIFTGQLIWYWSVKAWKFFLKAFNAFIFHPNCWSVGDKTCILVLIRYSGKERKYFTNGFCLQKFAVQWDGPKVQHLKKLLIGCTIKLCCVLTIVFPCVGSSGWYSGGDRRSSSVWAQSRRNCQNREGHGRQTAGFHHRH